MLGKYHIHIIFSVVGAIFGYLVFHPYTMLVYSLTHVDEGGKLLLHWKYLYTIALTTFKPMMLPMAISFAFFGGFIGLLIGILADRKEKLYVAEYENEKKKIALETLKKLMVTLSHYLLNANTIVGGMARRCRRIESKEDILASLGVIEEQAKRVDVVISALRKVTEIKTAHYTTEGQALMIDITQEIEEQLNQIKEKER